MSPDNPTRQSLRIAGLYCFFAACWILFSDQAVAWYVSDPHTMTVVAMAKGWFFVGITSLMLFVLVRRQLWRVGENSRAREEAEEAVRRSEARFRSLADLSPDIITIFNDRGHILFSSSATQRIHGYGEHDLVGIETFTLIHPEDQPATQKALADTLAHPEQPVVVRYRYRNKDGSYTWMEASVRNELGNPHLKGIIAISRDISERVRAEEERRQMQEQLIRAQKMEAIGQLAGGVAHDFNNILTVVAMNLEILRDEALPAQLRSVCNDLEEATGRATSLTRQLLLFARRQVVQKRDLDVDDLLGRLLNMLRRLIGENIIMEFHGTQDSKWVHADAGMMEQVVMNLVVNARDAMPGGGRIRISTGRVSFDENQVRDSSHPARRRGRFICICVTDSGCGMDAQTQLHIFEPFFTTKEAGKGTGLGLATVFGIVEQHDGWIEVESSRGQGSSFSVYLPERANHETPAPAPSATVLAGQESILVTEDDAGIRELCVNALRRLGYKVTAAANAREALEHWENNQGRFDLLLTDMIMPGDMTGLDLAKRLRALKPGLKIMVMSGYSLELSQHSDLDASDILYLAKPFNPASLTSSVRKVLA